MQYGEGPAITENHTDRNVGPYYEYPRDKHGNSILPEEIRRKQPLYPNYGDVPLGAAQRV
jgi:hypothetical protein